MFDFLQPGCKGERPWVPLRWWQRILHRLCYGLWFRRCYWCGRWYWDWHPSYCEYCSRECAEAEMDSLDDGWLCGCGRWNDEPWCCPVCKAEPPYGCLSDACENHDPEPEDGERYDPLEDFPW